MMIKRFASWSLAMLLAIAPAAADLQVGQLQGFWACPTSAGGSGITYIGDVENDTISGGDPTVDISGLSPAEDDLVVVCGVISNDAFNLGSDIGIVSPTGYTEVIITSDGSSANETTEVILAYKVQTATPDSIIVVQGSDDTSDGAAAIAMVLRGIDTSTPIDATSTTATGTNTDPDPASITTATTNAMVIACAGNGVAGLTAGVTAAPSGYSNFQTDFSSDTNDAEVATGTFINPGADAEDPGVFTDFDNAAAQAWGTVTAAIRGASAGAACTMPVAIPAFEFALTDSVTSASNATEYTFSGAALGVADATYRHTIVGAGVGDEDATGVLISTVTAAGVSATEVVSDAVNGAASYSTAAGLYIAATPTGTTGDIVVTADQASDGAGIGVWRMIGGNATASATASNTVLDSDTMSASLTIATGGVGVGYSFFDDFEATTTTTFTWTNLTEVFDEIIEQGDVDTAHSGASSSSAGAATRTAVADDASLADPTGVLALGAFDPL